MEQSTDERQATPPIIKVERANPTNFTKKSKKQLTAYWGISLSNDIFNHETIKTILKQQPQLQKLERIHSTLLYVGKKENDNEVTFIPHEKKECILTIVGVGYSANAMALKVESIKFSETEEAVPSFANLQHVTLALDEKTKAVSSVETLKGSEGTTFVGFEQPILLSGFVKRYMF